MSLNIKNAETHRLARELASLTGESVTTAVGAAVRERLTRVRRKQDGDLAEELIARATGEPLLFVGNDFAHTDLRSALR